MACRKSASGVKISIRCAISAARDIRMSDLAPFPVLGTGGAGYICSHAVLALQDAGWPVAVIDNLSTGFRFAVPDDVPFYEGDVADEALLGRIFAEQGTRAILHFAGSIIVPDSLAAPLGYYLNTTVQSRPPIAAADRKSDG